MVTKRTDLAFGPERDTGLQFGALITVKLYIGHETKLLICSWEIAWFKELIQIYLDFFSVLFEFDPLILFSSMN